MEHRKEVVRRLGQLEELRQSVQNVERALQVLTPEERLVVQMLCICPERGAAQKLCGILHVEQAQVYRKKNRAIKKLARALGMD